MSGVATPDEALGPVLSALHALYQGTDAQAKEQANQFLEQFQQNAESWSIAHAILQSPATGAEAKLFAAQTLKLKISYDFHQLPEDSIPGLRDSLLRLFLYHASGSKPVMIQLSLALANLALQFTSWKNVLDDVYNACSQDKRYWPCLLQFLTVLPEEITEGKRASLSEQELDMRVKELLSDSADRVLHLLQLYLENSETGSSDQAMMLQCLTSWLKEVSINKIVSSPLIDIVFKDLASPSLFDDAVDLICAMTRETSDVDESLESIKALHQRIIALQPQLNESRSDADSFRGLSRIFCEAGDAWRVLIARMPREFYHLVELIGVTATFGDDLDIVKFSFDFWYELAQLITLERYVEARTTFGPIYDSLVDVIINHLHYPEGETVNDCFDGDRETEDKFRSFRYEMGDVLKDCCRVIGGSVCLHKAHARVMAVLNSNTEGKYKWQYIEAPLFSMRAMGREVDVEENVIVPEIMKMLVQLPEHVKVRYAATLVLGRYTEWTAHHPEYLEFQMNYISSGFKVENKDVLSAAAQALKHFCRDCNKLLVDHISQLHPFYEHVYSALEFEDLCEVTEGIAHVVAIQALDKMSSALAMFIRPILERIVSYNEKARVGDVSFQRKVANEIELLCIFIENVAPIIPKDQPHPCLPLMQEVWNVLSITLTQVGKVQFVSERSCNCLRLMVFSYRSHLLPLLPQIIEKLVAMFYSLEYGSYLWVSGTIVRQLGHEDLPRDQQRAIWNFVEQQSVNMFNILNKTGPQDIPDLIEDFFRMLIDALLCHFPDFITSQLLPGMIQATLASLPLIQFEPLMAVLHFLRDFLAYGGSSPPTSQFSETLPELQRIVIATAGEAGPQLTAVIFSGLVFSYPRDCVDDASAALMTLVEIHPENAILWLSDAMNSLPRESLSIDERTRFIRNLKVAAEEKDFKKIRRSLQDFTARYRRRLIPRTNMNGGNGQKKFSFK